MPKYMQLIYGDAAKWADAPPEVTGSIMGSIPVSSSTVTTHIVLVPDIPGYSTCSMITKPASASG